MTDILNIEDEPIFDDRIVKIETHAYNPFANTTFGYSDEIRIPIQQQNLYTLPYESFVYIEGKLTKNRVVEGSDVVLGNNSVSCSMRFDTSLMVWRLIVTETWA
ncbi:hypothetical protein P5V15_015813 [Pogonomyrmex californicus]